MWFSDMDKTLIKKLTALTLSVLLLLAAIAAPIGHAVSAAEYIAYDYTEIESDLADVNILGYPKNPLGRHRLLDEVGFMEYAYSESSFISGTYYGIYLYVYNPTEKAVVEETGANVVNMAVSYDAEGEPAAYKNTPLRFLDKTANNRFLKFRLEDPTAVYETARAYAEAHDGMRRYDIASIQLLFKGDDRATDSLTGREQNEGVSFTYYCTGYSAGCDDVQSDENTLEIIYKKLDTVSLDVRSTWYRTDNLTPAAENTEKRYTLSSVYFAVPNYYMENYGALQIVAAEWYEYRSSLVLVTDDDEIETKLKRYAGYTLPYARDFLNEKTYLDPGIDMSFYNYVGPSDSGRQGLGWNNYNSLPSLQRYDWVIGTDDLTKAASGKLLEEYANSYPVGSDVLNVAGRTYNAHLFSDEIDEGHTRGYNQKVFDARNKDQWLDLKMHNNVSGWDAFWSVLFTGKYPKEDWLIKEDVKPIEELTSSRLEKSYYELSKDILVDESELDALRGYVKDGEAEDKTTFLLRFSLSEYDATTMEFHDGNGFMLNYPKIVGYQDAVYLGFDIIYLGFVREDKVTIIPCVADPIDIYPAYTPSDALLQDRAKGKGLGTILLIIIIIILLILLWPVLPYILQFLWWLIKLPFKGIRWICGKVATTVKRRRDSAPAREAERKASQAARREKKAAAEEARRERRCARNERLLEDAQRIRSRTAKRSAKRKKPSKTTKRKTASGPTVKKRTRKTGKRSRKR